MSSSRPPVVNAIRPRRRATVGPDASAKGEPLAAAETAGRGEPAGPAPAQPANPNAASTRTVNTASDARHPSRLPADRKAHMHWRNPSALRTNGVEFRRRGRLSA